ncbi:unnamed protein product [Taenia asiatica]|uniref:Uncharacterized protein n=1 Tax=Taenia asiatica TaxID=60517 RepID=A0A0R3VYF1_TAEAS|nr:unnamed protein product [Taenia asiatica]
MLFTYLHAYTRLPTCQQFSSSPTSDPGLHTPRLPVLSSLSARAGGGRNLVVGVVGPGEQSALVAPYSYPSLSRQLLTLSSTARHEVETGCGQPIFCSGLT